VGLRLTLNQHTGDLSNWLFFTKGIFNARVDKIAYHVLECGQIVLVILDQVNAEVLRQGDFLDLLLGLGNWYFDYWFFVSFLSFPRFRDTKNVVPELVDLSHKLLFGLLLSFKLKVSIANPKLYVYWTASEDS